MKRLILTIAIIILALLYAGETKAEIRHGGGYGYFYTSLAPHGMWIELDDGVTVWRPTIIRRGWAPYMHGQWIWTSDGWYWDSYEPFGYITYHYGRWYLDDYYGWIWVPDYEWAPAWVEWRYDDNYIGWAPLPPYAIFSVNIGIHFSIDYHTPYNHWHFVKYRYFCDPSVDRYYVGSKYKHRIHSNTKYRTNYAYEGGRVVNRSVDVDYVRQRTGQTIRTRDIERVSNPRDIESGRDRGNSATIRTFAPSREELTRERGDVEIKRAERKSSLETSRVEIGGRNSRATERTNTREAEKVRTDNNGRSNESIRNRSSEGSRTNPERDASPRTRDEQPSQPNVEQRNNQPAERRAEPRVEQRTENKPQPNVEQRSSKPAERKAEPRAERRTETQRQSAPKQERVEPRQQQRENPSRVERQGNSERRSESSGRERRQR